MKRHSALWWIGQFLSPMIGYAMWSQYSPAAGLATAYALLVLVDIRDQLTPNVVIEGLPEGSPARMESSTT